MLGVIDQANELRRAILNSRRKRDDGSPARRRQRFLAEAFVKLSKRVKASRSL